MNYQPQKIYVLRSEEALGKIRSITRSTYQAPTVLLVCYDERLSWKRQDGFDSGEMDATIVATHMMLEAWEQGIGSCWVMVFDPDEISRQFNLPSYIHPVSLLPIGYPSAKAKPYRPWHDVFRPLDETVKYL